MILKVLLAPLVAALFVLLVLRVTFSPLEANWVLCEPKIIVLETHQLYSRLISCTRKISTLHLEFKCVCVGVGAWVRERVRGWVGGCVFCVSLVCVCVCVPVRGCVRGWVCVRERTCVPACLCARACKMTGNG